MSTLLAPPSVRVTPGVVGPSHGGTTVQSLAELERAVVRLAREARTAERWSAGERRAVLAAVDRVGGLLSTARGDVLVAEREAGSWRGSGDPTFEAWRGRTSRVGAGEVRRELRRADAAAHLPAVRNAVAEGAATTAHLDALATVVHRAPAPVREALAVPAVQAELVDAARRLDAGSFATLAARVAARLDPAAHERSHQAQRAARFLHLTETPDGTRLSGQVDRMAGHRLRLALEAVSPRPALDDERTSEQRRADALGVLAEKVLSDPGTLTGASVRPHVSFHMTAETWAGLRTSARERAAGRGAVRAGQGTASGGPGAVPTALGAASAGPGAEPSGPVTASSGPGAPLGFEPVTLDDGTAVAPSEIARALCDCELTRIVTDAQGAVLDVGRTQRTYTGAQRRAVVARDRECAWNGCTAQARWCEVHHIRWWDRDGGETSIENGVLLCSFHHHETHRMDLTIHRRPAVSGVARASYVFRDPQGRTRSAPDATGPPPPPAPAPPAPPSPDERPRPHERSVPHERPGVHEGGHGGAPGKGGAPPGPVLR